MAEGSATKKLEVLYRVGNETRVEQTRADRWEVTTDGRLLLLKTNEVAAEYNSREWVRVREF